MQILHLFLHLKQAQKHAFKHINTQDTMSTQSVHFLTRMAKKHSRTPLKFTDELCFLFCFLHYITSNMIKSHFNVEEDPGAAHRQKGKQRKMLFVGDCWYRRGGTGRAFDGLTSLSG